MPGRRRGIQLATVCGALENVVARRSGRLDLGLLVHFATGARSETLRSARVGFGARRPTRGATGAVEGLGLLDALLQGHALQELHALHNRCGVRKFRAHRD